MPRAHDATADEVRLLQAFRMRPGDLEANRTGHLSRAQASRLRRSGWFSVAAAVLIAATADAVVYLSARSPVSGWRNVLAAVIVGAVLGVGALVARSHWRAARSGTVVRHTGTVLLRARGRHGGSRISIGGQSIQLQRRPQGLRDGARYRVYLAPAARIVVAIEPASAHDADGIMTAAEG